MSISNSQKPVKCYAAWERWIKAANGIKNTNKLILNGEIILLDLNIGRGKHGVSEYCNVRKTWLAIIGFDTMNQEM